ncbi:MAG: hypothetical protein H0U18_04160 [Pyrinomonadaceae bacterium]|nr:hypothetical protein [Pyrinomonadaceae bacterium]
MLSPQNASACWCFPPDVTKAIRDANAIFSGTVVEVSSGRVVFDIDEVWKGNVSGRFILSYRRSSCDLNFKAGRRYLIYARKYKQMLSEEDRWSTNQYQGSKSMADTEIELRKLWRLKLNKSQTQALSQERNPNKSLQRTGISGTLIDSLLLSQLSPGR